MQRNIIQRHAEKIRLTDDINSVCTLADFQPVKDAVDFSNFRLITRQLNFYSHNACLLLLFGRQA